MRVICIYLQKSQNLQTLAESVYRLTPQVCMRGGEALFLEITQCQSLYSEQNIFLRLQALLKRLNIEAKITAAPDAPTALAKARYHAADRLDLPIGALHDFASPFEFDSDLFRQCEKIVTTLERLGVRTLKDFVKLPVKSLSSRFGELGVKLYSRVLNSKDLIWPRFTPVEQVVERMDWGHELACDTLDSVYFYIKTLLDRSLLRLYGRGERLLKFELKLELEKNSLLTSTVRQWNFEFNVPHGTTRSLLTIVREKVSFDLQSRPLESFVNAMEIKILETAPAQFAQKDLFNPKREEDQEAWDNLVVRLKQRLGSESVFCAKPVETYMPEKSWATTDKHDFNGHESSFPKRPNRLLKDPQNVDFDGSHLKIEKQQERVVSFFGPEVLAGQWWDTGFERSYYRVLLEKGRQFWIFLKNGRFYLHGIYD